MAVIQFKVISTRGAVSPDGVFYTVGSTFFADVLSVSTLLSNGQIYHLLQ